MARYLTPRRSRYGFGPHIESTALALGRPLMPWQIEAANLIGETDEHGRILHPLVVITVPRQSGKTMLMWAVMLQRMLHRPAARIWYTAQLGMHARKQLSEMADALDLTQFKPLVHSKRGAGDTSIAWKMIGSRIEAFPPTPDSLHGVQSDLVVLDEAWAYDEQQAAALMGAIKPTQNTRVNGQIIVVSTMGTAESTWFHGLIERGRAGDPTVCLIDHGIDAETEATDENIYAAHPSADRNNFTFDKLIEAKADLTTGEYLRAYGNRPTVAAETIWPVEAWQTVQTSASIPEHIAPAFAAAVSIDRTQTVIAAAALVDGTVRTQIIEARPGVDWAPARLDELDRDHANTGVFIPPRGPSGTLAIDAEQLGVPLAPMSSVDDLNAAADLSDRVESNRIEIGSHPELDKAFAAAQWRDVGDGARALGRRASSGSIAALEAVAYAAWAAGHAAPSPEPKIWSMSE